MHSAFNRLPKVGLFLFVRKQYIIKISILISVTNRNKILLFLLRSLADVVKSSWLPALLAYARCASFNCGNNFDSEDSAALWHNATRPLMVDICMKYVEYTYIF